jgi:hypothetical protein
MKLCGVPNCGVKHYAKGWCRRHWRHSERYIDWTAEGAAKADAAAGFVSGDSRGSAEYRAGCNASAQRRRTANYEQSLAADRAKRAKERARLSTEALRATYRRRKGMPTPTRPEPANCECCGKSLLIDGLCLDHDHVTGKFRGWLCNFCNTAIGKLGDSLAGVRRAVAYLEKFG